MKKIFIILLLAQFHLFTVAQNTVTFDKSKGGWQANDLLTKLNPKAVNSITVSGCNNFILEIKNKNNQQFQSGKTSPMIITKIPDNNAFDDFKPMKLICTCNDDSNNKVSKEYGIFEQKNVSSNETDFKFKCEKINDLLQKNDCDIKRTLENDFGEDIATYDKDKIVYIYNFGNKQINSGRAKGNTDTTSQGYFKIVRVEELKNNKTVFKLKTTPVNFNKEVLRAKNHIQFKVININRFRYNISIEDSIVKFDSQPSALFNQIFGISPEFSAGLFSNFKKGISIQGVSVKTNNLNSLFDKIECFSNNYITLNAKILSAYNECADFSCCNDFVPIYEQLAKNLFEIKADSVFNQQSIVKDLNDSLKNAKGSLDKCNQKKEKLTKLQNDIVKIKAKKEADLTIIEKETLASSPEEEKKLKADLCSSNTIDSLNLVIKKLESKLQFSNALNEFQKKLPTETDIIKKIAFIQRMSDQNTTYMYERLTLNGNRLDFTINIQSKDTLKSLIDNNKPIIKSVEIPIVGRPFISFSSGPYVIVDKSLVNKTYDWQPLPNNSGVIGKDSTKYILAESGYSAPMMGFAAMANGEIKLSRFLGIGLSTGVGLTIETKPRLAYLLGVSLFLGELRQFAITAGVAVTQVDKLNNNLLSAYNERISYTSSSRQDIKYYQEAKAGFFIAITYTPFKAAKSR